jgi:hypothetical protein
MAMNIPEFSNSEWQLVSRILHERYGRAVEPQLADVDLQLDPTSNALTTCPALYWNELGAEFILVKVADQTYRCQFYYSTQEQFGTGREVYKDLSDCVMTLLRLQADHHATRSLALTGARDGQTAVQDDEYRGPLVI